MIWKINMKLNNYIWENIGTQKISYRVQDQGPVVRKPVNANLGLEVNQGFCFSC